MLGYTSLAQDESVKWRWRYGNPNIYFNYGMPWSGREIIVEDISGLFNASHQIEFWLRWSPKSPNIYLTVRFTDDAGGVSKVVSVKQFLIQGDTGYTWYYRTNVKIKMSEFIQEGFDPARVREIILDIPRVAGEGRVWADDILIRRL
jgi:hypothetical protein